MITVLSILGTRPEAIKMAPVIKELERHPDQIRSVVCATGQHRQMLDQVLSLFAIRPLYDLNVMKADQSLAGLTAALFSGVDEVVKRTEPHWILAQGDTTSVLVASLIAYYHRIHFGHVEAGLRTDDLYSPFPEELNRRIADMTAAAHFAPTERARLALLREGYPGQQVYVTGNTVVDALIDIANREFSWTRGPLSCLPSEKRLVLITAHRRESFGEPFRELCLAIKDLSARFSSDGIHFIYPVHLNPNVRRPVGELLSGLENVSLIEPLDYLSLVHLMKRSVLVMTDSGGIQEEAPSLGVPVVVMRDTTERPEGVDAGVAWLVGTSRERITTEVQRLLTDPEALDAVKMCGNPYGDGRAAERIVSVLLGEANNE